MYNHIYNVSFFLSTGHPQILYHSDVYRSLPMGPLIANTTYNPQSYSTSSTPNSTRYQQPLSHLSGGPASFQYVASPQSSYQATSPLHPRPATALYGQYTPVQVVPAYLSSPRHMSTGGVVGTTIDQGTGLSPPTETYTTRHWNPPTYP